MNETVRLLEEALKGDHSDRHSHYQLKHFLIEGEPTRQARLWQAVREMRSRRDAVNSICLEIEEARDQLTIDAARAEMAEGRATTVLVTVGPEHPRARIAAAKARKAARRALAGETRISDLHRKLRNVLEEARYLIDLFTRMGGREAMLDWDDPTVQKEYWNAKAEDEVRRRLVAGQGLEAGLVAMVEKMHKEAPVRRLLNAYLRNAGLLDAPAEQEVGPEHGKDDLQQLDAGRLGLA